MATETTPSGNGANGGGGARMLKRYGPIALVVVVIVGVIAIVGALNGGDDDSSSNNKVNAGGDTAGSLPLTYQEAKAQGKADSIDWGSGCDTKTGRIKMPVHNALPCVEPWPAGKDNGGATSQGVTKDSILVAVYQAQPDPLQQAIVEGAGADTDPTKVSQTQVDYVKMFEAVAQTYGRKLDVRTIIASGGPTDATAAQADAQKVIDMKAFAAIGGPGQTPAWLQALVAAKIVCMCGTAQPQQVITDSAPYLWPQGQTPEQANALFVEMVGKQLVGKKAEFAGDDATKVKPRVFGWVQAETQTDQYKSMNATFDKELEDKYDGKVAARSTYLFDASNAANIATTVIARMKDAGVTTILFSGDPLIPKQITQEATKQNYFPEWVVGPSVLADTTIFGRTFDQKQWAHAIGLGITTARTERELDDSFTSYKWFYGKDVPVNSQAVLYGGPARLITGIHLAGPDLTPQTFAQGMFRFPPVSGYLTAAHVSWGNKLWTGSMKPDYNDADDATTWWWDPTAKGQDEAGNEGTGMLMDVAGGKRYLPGDFPTSPIPYFQKQGAVAVYDKDPDNIPQYPAWPGSPAAG
jgi:hypothetical protein